MIIRSAPPAPAHFAEMPVPAPHPTIGFLRATKSLSRSSTPFAVVHHCLRPSALSPFLSSAVPATHLQPRCALEPLRITYGRWLGSIMVTSLSGRVVGEPLVVDVQVELPDLDTRVEA